MRRRDLLKTMSALSAAAALPGQTTEPRKRYEANWASLDPRPIPKWYTDAKFGIFIHWGVYSVPAYAPVNVPHETPYAEWYWHSLTEGKKTAAAGKTAGDGAHTWAYHQQVYGADFPYFDFAPQFRAELFDPDHWADIFARSGAKYVALTSKHHEGFTLWRNEQANRAYGRPWNAVDTGPKRDVLLALSEAGRSKGLQMGIYYSLYEWYNPLWLNDKPRYVSEHLFPQFKDVVTHVKPAIIFSDGEWEISSADWRSPELLSWLYNDSPVADTVVVDDRWGKDTRHKHGGYYTTEYTSGMQMANHPWEESRGMGFSYGYNRRETLKDYHTDRQLLLMLLDIVSRGGNLLLDIGPRADGQIPTVMEERLLQMGDWLRVNGEAVYGTTAFGQAAQWSEGTRPHLESSEFQSEYDISNMVDTPPAGMARIEAFFTAKPGTVYAIVPHPFAEEVVLRGLSSAAPAKVTLLGSGIDLPWKRRDADVVVSLPVAVRLEQRFQHAYVLKLQS